jgi:hypothetical protein
MNRQLIVSRINEVLDEWDPLGTNHFQGMRGDEYVRYVPRVVQKYLAGTPTYDSLYELQEELIDNASQEMIEDTRRAAHAIDQFLSSCEKRDLYQLFPPLEPM